MTNKIDENEVAEYWNNHIKDYDESTDYSYGLNMRPLALNRLYQEGHLKKVVEFGCGTGYFTKGLAEISDSVLATDLVDGFLDIAKEQLKQFENVDFDIANCEKTSLPDESFDTVFMALTLALTDVIRTLGESKRILKPGGKFIAISSGPALISRFALFKYYIRRIRAGFFKPSPGYGEYTPEEYRSFAEQVGFKLDSLEILKGSENKSSVPLYYIKMVKP